MIDTEYMREALDLAARGLGRTRPNPPVGAVVVRENSGIVGRGWHERAGDAHAEIIALQEAGESAHGATLYVTLEPCNHSGRTGPCTEAILQAGISRVVIGARDPNPHVAGGGAAHLERHGVRVDVGVCEDDAVWLIRCFSHHARHGRPWVIAKTATSLDGRVATATGDSQWITGEEARAHAHGVRAWVDAILVGVGTVVADNPRLTVRLPHKPKRQPLRVILDDSGRTPLDATVVAPGTLIIATDRMPADVRRSLEDSGCQIEVCAATEKGWVSIESAVNVLGSMDIQSLLVEGGPTVMGSFLDASCVDEWHAYVAPILIGGAGAPASVAGIGTDRLAHTPRLRDRSFSWLGEDLFVRGTLTDWRL